MKKTILILIAFIAICSFPRVNAEEIQEFSVAEKIKSFMLVNNPEAMTGVSNAVEETLQTTMEEIRKYYVSTNQGRKIEPEMKGLRDDFTLFPENSFCFYPLITIRYAKQYADNYSFDLLIDNSNKIWTAKCKSTSEHYYFDKDFSETLRYVKTYDKNTIEFLNQPNKIEQMIKEQIDEEIVDCKILMLNKPYDYLVVENNPQSRRTGFYNCGTILYLKGVNTDYGMKIFTLTNRENDSAYLEDYKIYKISEIMNSCSNYETGPLTELLDQKPTYDTESAALMDAGVISGTDKGMEPLKPLSRIEATAIIVRVLGLEEEPTSSVSQFADIPSDNWGTKYANIALDNGISYGVGDDNFAPNQLIDANQFSSMILRSTETEAFDWQIALNMLIDRDIITQENADTMDLFTRGDMAKIIYEAREKGLL